MKRILKLLNFAGWGFLTLVVLTSIYIIINIFVSVPIIPRVPDRLSQLIEMPPSRVFASDGSLLTQIGGRDVVPIERVPHHFQHAVLAAEDDQFYKHAGIDKPALVKAVVGRMGGSVSRGGSTITQQLAKNLFFTVEKSVTRKFREMLAALEIERSFEKRDILEAYCNWNPYGGATHGIEEAASHFFGTHASELTLAQSALLAGLPNSPSWYNPYRHPERAAKRQRWILSRMKKLGYISESEYQFAINDSLEFKPLYASADEGNYFLDAVLDELESKYGKDVIYHGGLKIYTTLDPLLQGYAISAMKESLDELDKRFKLDPFEDAEPEERKNYVQGTLVAVENSTGAVKALVGGRDWYASQFNRALQRNRSMGSSLKPALYLTAIEELDFTPATVVTDTQVVIDVVGAPDWRPRNFSKDFRGPIILKEAFQHSINTVAAQLIKKTEPDAMIETLQRLGITSDLKPYYSLALGSSSVSAVEMAGMVASIANEGLVVEPYIIRRVEDFEGHVLQEQLVSMNRQFTPEDVYLLIDMMKGVFETGTGKYAKNYGFNRPGIGKTGTTNDYRDAWFVGATPGLSASTWVGFDDNRPMVTPNRRGITGSSGALPVWARFMARATEGAPVKDFNIPPGIDFEPVDINDGSKKKADDENVLTVALPEDFKFKEIINIPPVDNNQDTDSSETDEQTEGLEQ